MKNIFIALSASLLLLGACATSEEIDKSGDVQASFGDAVNFTSTLTRVTEGNLWEDNDAVGIYCEDYYSNIKYAVTNSGSTMSAATDVIYYVSEDEVTYTAYYPYVETISNALYPIDLSSQSANVEDMYLLFASSKSTANSVNLTFEHKLAMVEFTYKAMAGVTLTGDILLRLSNVGVTSTLDLTTGELSAEPELGSIEMTVTVSDASEVSFKTMMLPMESLADLKVEFCIDSSWWLADFGDLSANSWESGKSYDLTINASNGESSGDVSSISITGNLSTIYTSGESATMALTATVYPVIAEDKSVTWSSSDESVAIVSEEGVVTAVAVGSATIIATSVANPSISSSILVSVEVGELSVGDILYSDGSYGAYYNNTKSVLGVIYSLNEDGKSGMIVSIDEAQSLAWATSNSDILIKNNEEFADYTWGLYSLNEEGYGMEGTQEVHNYIAAQNADIIDEVDKLTLAADFPAFEWIANLNSTAVDYTTLDADVTGVWYMPGEGCLKVLLPAAATTSINTRLAAIEGATQISCDNAVNYLSSTELPTDGAKYRRIMCNAEGTCTANGQAKSSTSAAYRTRAVMAFDIDADFN